MASQSSGTCWKPGFTSTPLKMTEKQKLSKSVFTNNNMKITELFTKVQLNNSHGPNQSLRPRNRQKGRVRNKKLSFFESLSPSSSEDGNAFKINKEAVTLSINSLSTKKLKDLDEYNFLDENFVITKENNNMNTISYSSKLQNVEGKRHVSSGKTKGSSSGKIKVTTLRKKIRCNVKNKNSVVPQLLPEENGMECKSKQKFIGNHFEIDPNMLQKYDTGVCDNYNKAQHFCQDISNKSVHQLIKDDVGNELSIFISPYNTSNITETKEVVQKFRYRKSQKTLTGKTTKDRSEGQEGQENLLVDRVNLSHQLFSDNKGQELLNSLNLTLDSNDKLKNSDISHKENCVLVAHNSKEHVLNKEVWQNVGENDNLNKHVSEDKNLNESKEDINIAPRNFKKTISSSKCLAEIQGNTQQPKKLNMHMMFNENTNTVGKDKKSNKSKLIKPCKIPVTKSLRIYKKEISDGNKGDNLEEKELNLVLGIKQRSEEEYKVKTMYKVEQHAINNCLTRKRKITIQNHTREGIKKKHNKIIIKSNINLKLDAEGVNSNDDNSNKATLMLAKVCDPRSHANRKNGSVHCKLRKMEKYDEVPRLNDNKNEMDVESREEGAVNTAVSGTMGITSTTPSFNSVSDVFKQFNSLTSFKEFRPGCSIFECWSLKNYKCGILRVEANSENSGRTAHENSYFGGIIIKGGMKMKVDHEEVNLTVGDMTFVPPLKDWCVKNISDTEAVMYYWCGRFKAL